MVIRHVKAEALTAADLGSRIIMNEDYGTVQSKILIGVQHILREYVLKEEYQGEKKGNVKVIRAEYHEVILSFADSTHKTFAKSANIQVSEDHMRVDIRNSTRIQLP